MPILQKGHPRNLFQSFLSVATIFQRKEVFLRRPGRDLKKHWRFRRASLAVALCDYRKACSIWLSALQRQLVKQRAVAVMQANRSRI